jgi:hypothetical protein
MRALGILSRSRCSKKQPLWGSPWTTWLHNKTARQLTSGNSINMLHMLLVAGVQEKQKRIWEGPCVQAHHEWSDSRSGRRSERGGRQQNICPYREYNPDLQARCRSLKSTLIRNSHVSSYLIPTWITAIVVYWKWSDLKARIGTKDKRPSSYGISQHGINLCRNAPMMKFVVECKDKENDIGDVLERYVYVPIKPKSFSDAVTAISGFLIDRFKQ